MVIENDQIKLFGSLFHGREDVFAIRWEKGNKSGYMPSYQFDLYQYRIYKAKGGTLSNYQDKTFQPLTDEQIKRHLLGEQLIGIYPLLANNASNFIAADFDGDNWLEEAQKFIKASDSNDYARSEKVLRALEKKYNLTEVLPSKQAKEQSMTKNELEMMKRTNSPSQKMAMQIILKDVLQSNYKMNTNEFISNLQAKGVDVVFNQASTGHVSGISYGYQGMIITGAKLGNDFKWSSIKNRIDYGSHNNSQSKC